MCVSCVLLLTVNKVQGRPPQANVQTAPQALTGYKWLSLLHVRGVLIPALNELANGRPFPLTLFPHTFTHQALLACPPGHQRLGECSGSPSTLELGLKLRISLMFSGLPFQILKLLNRVLHLISLQTSFAGTFHATCFKLNGFAVVCKIIVTTQKLSPFFPSLFVLVRLTCWSTLLLFLVNF